jgi:hypothetical protein
VPLNLKCWIGLLSEEILCVHKPFFFYNSMLNMGTP